QHCWACPAKHRNNVGRKWPTAHAQLAFAGATKVSSNSGDIPAYYLPESAKYATVRRTAKCGTPSRTATSSSPNCSAGVRAATASACATGASAYRTSRRRRRGINTGHMALVAREGRTDVRTVRA
ncbi:unnamed protein product, partial [Nesidiocoris tenuis]